MNELILDDSKIAPAFRENPPDDLLLLMPPGGRAASARRLALAIMPADQNRTKIANVETV